MLFDIRPVHVSYIAKDRESSSWFLRKVLGLKVVRHEEYRLPSSTTCPKPLDDQWCKTIYAYGPESTHFAIQLVFCYKGHSQISFGNDFTGAKIRSLEAIARAKAIGIEGSEESDGTFLVYGKVGHGYWLADHLEHDSPDPYYEEVMQVTALDETMHYWNSLLGVDIIDLKGDQFSLFFCNSAPRLTFQQSAVPLVMSPAHLGFTMPRAQLKEMSSLMMRSGKVVYQPFSKVDYMGRNADYLVILKDPTGYFLYFYDVESFNSLSKFDPQAEARLSISLLKEKLERANHTRSSNALNIKNG